MRKISFKKGDTVLIIGPTWGNSYWNHVIGNKAVIIRNPEFIGTYKISDVVDYDGLCVRIKVEDPSLCRIVSLWYPITSLQHLTLFAVPVEDKWLPFK